jgi:hypothetical protein
VGAADQVRVEAQHLAKLDPGGAELTQGSAEPLPRGQGRKIRIRDPGSKPGAKSGVGSGCSVIGQPSEPIPGEDVSNLLDAIPVMEEHTSNVVRHVRFSILACTIRRRPPGRYRCGLTAATIANWNCGDLRLSGCRAAIPTWQPS